MKATIQESKPLDNSIAFRDLEAGEFLISDSGNVGVKTKDGDILWVVAVSSGAKVGTQTLTRDVSYGKRYKQPVSVVVTV